MNSHAVGHNSRTSPYYQKGGSEVSKVLKVIGLYILALGIQAAFFYGIIAFFQNKESNKALFYGLGAGLIISWLVPGSISCSLINDANKINQVQELEMENPVAGDL